MGYTTFDLDIADGIAHLRLNRPDTFNSMVRAFWNELPEAVTEIDREAKARVIVISSTGKHFCSGMDLAVFADGDTTSNPSADQARRNHQLRDWVKVLQNTFNCLDNARMPVLAAIQGGCIGGAVDMISACDMRYATADAFFCVQEINIGMTADVGTFPRLCHLIPQGWVRELCYTGRRLSAEKAKEIGLVNEVYQTHAELVDAVLERAREIAARSPLAIAGTKVMINYARDHTIADGLDYIATWQSGMFRASEMQEAFTAQMEKRPPAYDDILPIRQKM